MANDDFYCMHSEMCKTLANDKRQRILDALRDGEQTVSEIQRRTGVPQATLSQHLSIMRSRGVVTARRDGAHVHYSISNPKILQAFDLITEVMREGLDARGRVAEQEPEHTHAPAPASAGDEPAHDGS